MCISKLPCETVEAENKQQSQTNVVISDKSQGSIATHLRCSGIFNNLKTNLLLSLPVKNFVKSIYKKILAKLQVRR